MEQFTLECKTIAYPWNTFVHVVYHDLDSKQQRIELTKLLTNEYCLFARNLFKHGVYLDFTEQPTIYNSFVPSEYLNELDLESKKCFKEVQEHYTKFESYSDNFPTSPRYETTKINIVFEHEYKLCNIDSEYCFNKAINEVKNFDLLEPEESRLWEPKLNLDGGCLIYRWFAPSNMDLETTLRFYLANGTRNLYYLKNNSFVN